MTFLCAYPLSKKSLPGRTVITVYILITMFFSGGLIPLYLLVNSLGMVNTFWAMVLPSAISTWFVVLARTFLMNIPSEMEESASIDGAGHWKILTHIYLPLSKPIIATLSLFYAVAKWNSWFDASIFLLDKQKYPIQLILRNMMISGLDRADFTTASYSMFMEYRLTPTSVNYALTVAVILPIIFIYPFLQKYFIKGVMIGSLKG